MQKQFLQTANYNKKIEILARELKQHSLCKLYSHEFTFRYITYTRL